MRGALNLSTKLANKKYQKKGQQLAKKIIEEKTGPIRNGLHTLPKPETTEEAISNTNPLWDTPYGKMNCTSCVLAAHLRQQGYDVNGAAFGFLGAKLEKQYKSMIKNYDEITTKAMIKSKQQAEKKILEITNGKDGSGAIDIKWASGGAHIFNWKVENGKAVLYDTQPAGETIDINAYYKQSDKTKESLIYRFDTAEFDWTKLRNYVYG